MCSPVCESPCKSGSYLNILFTYFFSIEISNTVLCSHLCITERDEELCNEKHPLVLIVRCLARTGLFCFQINCYTCLMVFSSHCISSCVFSLFLFFLFLFF